MKSQERKAEPRCECGKPVARDVNDKPCTYCDGCARKLLQRVLGDVEVATTNRREQ
jgi:hypothetical protein